VCGGGWWSGRKDLPSHIIHNQQISFRIRTNSKWILFLCITRYSIFHSLRAMLLMPNTYHRRNDKTVLSRRRCEQNSQLAHDDCQQIRSTIWKLTRHCQQTAKAFDYINFDRYWSLLQHDVMMSSLLKKLTISIKIHVVKQLWSLARFQIDRIRRQSSWSSCEFMFIPLTPTRQNSFVASAALVCIGRNVAKRSILH